MTNLERNKEKNRIMNTIKHQHQVSLKFNGNIIVIGTYKNANTKIEYYCIEHDTFFFAIPAEIIKERRKGCSVCSGLTNWTTESVIKRIQYLNRDQYENNTLIIDEFEYKKLTQEIWLTCLIDGYRWKTTIFALIHRETGCPECYGTKKISFDELHERNNEINTVDGVLRISIKCTRKWYEENYKNNQTKIPVGCSEGHPDWWISVNKLLNQETGCPHCAIENSKVTREEFFSKIPKKFLNENGNPLHKYNLRTYNGTHSFIWIFDPEHGWFRRQVKYYLQGSGHPNAPKCKSKGELAVQEFLSANQIKFMREYNLYNTRLLFDFFLPDQNLAIEFDGPQHLEYDPWIHRDDYANFEKQQQNDRKKDQWCQDNNIQMVRITNIKDIPILLDFLSIEK